MLANRVDEGLVFTIYVVKIEVREAELEIPLKCVDKARVGEGRAVGNLGIRDIMGDQRSLTVRQRLELVVRYPSLRRPV